ncbi:MAG: hypothetical protein GXP50_07545 [Deltaproteobacteria bacterium]|nr:hypothetical protein [Deltaproteobacteria bacterium]
MLKVLAILEVASAHFLEPRFPIVWAPTAVSLLIFAYGSAYFTYRAYGVGFDRKAYWLRKAQRLGVRLLAVDAVLLGLFLMQGREGIWSWESLVCAVGLQGWLSWLYLPNPSPFGRGMWFLTLLLVFYTVYPWLARVLSTDRRRATWVTVGWCATAWALEWLFPYGHALWLTTCGFVVGTYAGQWGMPIGRRGGIGFLVLAGAAAVLNGTGVKVLNFPLLLGIFLVAVAWWHGFHAPRWVQNTTLPFAGCLLEIYLLHMYLFVHPTGSLGVDLLLSLALVLAVAKFLDGFVIYAAHLLNPKPEPLRTS